MENERYRQELTEKILAERKRRGLSYQAIADLTEKAGNAISPRTVCRALTGEGQCKIATLMIIGEAIGIDVGRNNTELSAENRELTARVTLLEHELVDKAEQIQSMRDMVKSQQGTIMQKDRRILILTVSLCVVLVAAALLLGFDILQPNTGYIVH